MELFSGHNISGALQSFGRTENKNIFVVCLANLGGDDEEEDGYREQLLTDVRLLHR